MDASSTERERCNIQEAVRFGRNATTVIVKAGIPTCRANGATVAYLSHRPVNGLLSNRVATLVANPNPPGRAVLCRRCEIGGKSNSMHEGHPGNHCSVAAVISQSFSAAIHRGSVFTNGSFVVVSLGM
jgi:hypothetical protein